MIEVTIEVACSVCKKVAMRAVKRLKTPAERVRWEREWARVHGGMRHFCCGQVIEYAAPPKLADGEPVEATPEQRRAKGRKVERVRVAARTTSRPAAELVAERARRRDRIRPAGPEAPSVPTVTTQGTETA